MKKRRVVLWTVLMLSLILAMGIFSVSAEDQQTPDPILNMYAQNLSFEDSVYIKYAVSVENASPSQVKLLVWTTPQTSYLNGTQVYTLNAIDEQSLNGNTCAIFRFEELAAKQMTDVVYARAYISDGENEFYSSVQKYSILQYAYNKLGITGTATENEELKSFLNAMLAYGAAAQNYFDYNTDALATMTYYQVKVVGGTLTDGCDNGLYLPQTVITITAPANDADGKDFSHWVDSTGETVGNTAACSITVGDKHETYTPVYVSYSKGLDFDSNGDGTCYVIGMGTCTDTELVIPPTSPDGDTVIGVEGFSGTAITSVSFPSTVEEIARRAFNSCTSLTDVYYDGTEEEWNNISISTGNDPIENATKHFNEPAVATFTVTFVDYDGTPLKTETVESGAAATAPEDPTRDGYTFTGWDKTFDQVMGDLTVMAKYEVTVTTPTIVVSSADAAAGETNVAITVALKNNPGVTSMLMEIEFDDEALDLVSMEYNSEIGGTGIPNASTESPITAYWADGFVDVTGDWTFVTLTFDVSSSATVGDHNITVSYNAEDIFNAAETNVSFEIINGKITVL